MPATHTDADVLRALLALQRDLALEVDLDRILERIARSACELLAADRSTIYVLDHEHGELFSRVMSGGSMSEIRLPLDGRSLAAAVARTGQTIVIRNAYEDPRFNPDVDARQRLWDKHLPGTLPVDDSIDLGFLARAFEVPAAMPVGPVGPGGGRQSDE